MSKLSPRVVARLIAAAARARTRSYSPYSHYPVGAAVLTASGRIHPGCNIESPTLIHHTCAERAAIFNALSHGDRALVAICTFSSTAYPCGTCRQAILEFLGPDAPIYSVLVDPRTGRRTVAETTAGGLLPHAYTETQLKAGRIKEPRATRRARAPRRS